MEDTKHVLDSAEPCTESIVNKEPGAGANAASAAEMVLITTSPLSELIWTPQEGLSLKYADSSKAEKKASFMWKAESFNMIISTSQCANPEECSTSRDHIAGDSTVQLDHSSHDNADPVAYSAPPRRSIDPQPRSLIGPHEQDTRPYGDKNIVKDRDEADLDLDQSVKNDEEPYTPRNTGRFETICPAEDVINRIQSSILSPGRSPELAETKAGIASTSGVSNEHLTEKARIQEYKTSGSIGVSGSHDSMSDKSGGNSTSSVGSTECKRTDSALDGAGDDNIEKLKNPARLPVHSGQNSFDIQFKNVGCRSKDAFNVAIPSQEVGKAETQQGNIKNETGELRSLSPYKVYPGKMEKGKEKILYDDDSNSSSKEKEDTSESVESRSSQRFVPRGKRAFSFDLKVSEGCKRTKQENNGPPWSKSLTRNDSSFLNWISTITSKFSRYDQNMTSMVLLPPSYNNMKENFGSLRRSYEKPEEIMCKTVGFNSFFQALYCPNIMVPDTDDDHHREARTSKDIKITGDQCNYSANHILGNFMQFKLNMTCPTRGKQTYNGLKEVHLTSQALAVGSLHIVCGKDTGKSHDQVSPSSERHNQVTYHVDDFPSIGINMSSSRPEIYEKLKQRNSQACALKNMNGASSSARKDFCRTDEKEHGRPSSDPKNSVNVMLNNKNDFFENSWITRFFQKVSSPILNSVKCNLSIDDNHTLSKEENFRKNHIPAQLESQREPAGEVQKHPTNLSFPWVLKKLDTQTLKPRISQIMPSEGLKKMELGQLEASCSRKRFDFNPSEMHNHNVSCAPMTCFFCGKDGHNLRECPELAETNLVDFRDFMGSYDAKDISSCFCLRCFQADHWAISCPRASLKIKKTTNSSFSIAHGSCHMIEEKPENRNIPNCTGKKSAWFRDITYKLSERGARKRDIQTLLPRSSSTANAIEDSQAESMVKKKQKASSSSENESRSNQIIPFYSSIVPDVANEQNRLFKAVRRLRLSRINLIRWMKSTNTSCSLEGFFVRVRLGKWEKGLGGTGYQVARIISASRENCLSVHIGNLQCSLECCFVSNQDYMEEELKAWLTTTLEADGKLPSMEELNKKFKEREELGL